MKGFCRAWLVAGVCLAAGLLAAPADASQGDEIELEEHIQCAVLLSSWAGYLTGRHQSGGDVGYDPEEVVSTMREGFAFSLIAIDISDRQGQSDAAFRADYGEVREGLRAHLSPDQGQEAVEAAYSEGLARCDDLRSRNSAEFEAKLPLVDSLFADQLAAVRADVEQ